MQQAEANQSTGWGLHCSVPQPEALDQPGLDTFNNSFSKFLIVEDKFGFLFLFFSFSWQSQMCQKKGNFYHYCQKRDSNNMPPSNTSVLFTRKKHTKSNRSLSTTQCTEIQMAPLSQHQESGASCTLFYKDFWASGGKEVISWFLSGIGDTKHYSHRKNRTHMVKYFQSYQASKPESQRNWGNHWGKENENSLDTGHQRSPRLGEHLKLDVTALEEANSSWIGRDQRGKDATVKLSRS